MLSTAHAIRAAIVSFAIATDSLGGGETPQPAIITYQGRLDSEGVAYSGSADLRFELRESGEPDSLQVGETLVLSDIQVIEPGLKDTVTVEVDLASIRGF